MSVRYHIENKCIQSVEQRSSLPIDFQWNEVQILMQQCWLVIHWISTIFVIVGENVFNLIHINQSRCNVRWRLLLYTSQSSSNN